ncbi:hypothetical protein [Nitrosospira sp. Nsp1]|uniref:phage tail fiber protein n=1 Tax=Nitrosospira sp. Nsp1 TaxID=136547 RepID=UPI000884E7EA|nr:hypothetical protein [Nitrosospira sp. Nsp1]SCX40356.1 hypothetical protein SAMN05720354_10396 [Nitrosospira sp. Nsp1]
MSAWTNYAENKIIDAVFRGQALGAPATWYIGLVKTDPGEAGGGTEVSGGSYARVSVAASLANWAGTQSAGSTVASSGAGGTTSNNVLIQYPAPTADWGQATHLALFDALTGGNAWVYSPLTTPKTINNGDSAPSFAISALTFQVDN